jgi:hypothetical protein
MIRPVTSRILAAAFALLILPAFASASAQAGKTYKHLIVQSFDGPEGGDFPADFADSLRRNVVKQLTRTKRFESLTFIEKGQPVPADADLILTGKIVRFDKGSRGARYLVPGTGITRLQASIAFTEPSAEKPLLEQRVSGRVSFGVFGGDSMGATQGLAKQLAKAVKKELR